MLILYMEVVNSSQSVGLPKCRMIPAIYWMTPRNYHQISSNTHLISSAVRYPYRESLFAYIGHLKMSEILLHEKAVHACFKENQADKCLIILHLTGQNKLSRS